jgi:hypothetical protein
VLLTVRAEDVVEVVPTSRFYGDLFHLVEARS